MFGITNVSNRHCTVVGCKKTATTVIGDTRYKYNLKNLFLCDEHLQELYNELINVEAFKQPTSTVNNDDSIKGQEIIKSYLKLIYEANGMLSKAKLVEFCKDNGIEVPDDATIKKYMEIIFPELKEK